MYYIKRKNTPCVLAPHSGSSAENVEVDEQTPRPNKAVLDSGFMHTTYGGDMTKTDP